MSKQVARDAVIEVRESVEHEWINISDHVTGWDWPVRVGDLLRMTFYLIYDRNEHVITGRETGFDEGERAIRVPVDDRVVILGQDISRNLFSYSIHAEVGAAEELILTLYCDSDVLRINGTAPWEPPR